MKILKVGKISRKDKLNMKKLEIPNKEILQSLYLDKCFSLSKIATIFNTSTMTVRAWLSNKKIKCRISNINLYHELRKTDFNDIQKQLLIGSVLGDGCLRIPKHGKNASFSERHCEKQREYLEWKKELLMPFVPRKLDIEKGGNHVISGIKCVTQDSYRFQTIAHPYLTALWKFFYRGNGNKILPEEIKNFITEFVIAVWICDDGCLSWGKRDYNLDLHTENFSYKDNIIISKCLSKFFNGRIKIYHRKYKSGLKYYISLRGKEEIHDLCKRLIKLVPDSMQYKFNTYI